MKTKTKMLARVEQTTRDGKKGWGFRMYFLTPKNTTLCGFYPNQREAEQAALDMAKAGNVTIKWDD